MSRSTRALWFRIGLGVAFATAVLPVLVALLHLMPVEVRDAPAHQPHAQPMHAAAVGTHAEMPAHKAHQHEAPVAPLRDTSDSPRDEQPWQAAGHCPLCFWLQGLHALPAPDASPVPLPSGIAAALPRYEPSVRDARFATNTQPRAPPILLSAG